MSDFSHSAPPDPGYAPFVEGLRRVAADVNANPDYYWYQETKKWYVYPHADWILEDPGITPTTDSDAFGAPELEWKDDKTRMVLRLRESALKDIFVKVRDDYAKALKDHPTAYLIWHPIGGWWRNATKRKGAGGSGADLPPEAIRRLKEVDEQVRAGIIDHATGEQRKLEILAEYEPRP